MKKFFAFFLLLAFLVSCRTKDTSATTLHTADKVESLTLNRLRLNINDSMTKETDLSIDSISISPAFTAPTSPRPVITFYNIRRSSSSIRQKSSSVDSSDTVIHKASSQRSHSSKNTTARTTASPRSVIFVLFSLFLSLLSIRWLTKKLGSENKKT